MKIGKSIAYLCHQLSNIPENLIRKNLYESLIEYDEMLRSSCYLELERHQNLCNIQIFKQAFPQIVESYSKHHKTCKS